MYSQIRRLLERHQHTTRGSLVATVTAHNTQFAATKTTATVQETIASAPKAEAASHTQMGNFRKLDNIEKRFLVWTGKYKSIADVPNSVSVNMIEKARNKVRIRAANYMIGLTLIGCVIFAISGKAAAKRGETVKKMNLDWHKKINEEEKSAK